MKLFVLAACLAVAVAAESLTDSALWQNFRLTHKKEYSSKSEEVLRFNVFQQNLRKIEEHNKKYDAGEVSHKLGVNQFADMTKEEFGAFLRTSKLSFNSTIPRTKFVKKIGASVPKAVDWRKNNAVTPIKDQGDCGGCWAFATTGALEGAYAIKNKKLVSFSEQQLLDCAADDYGMAGCDGGQLDPAFQYMQDYGMETEKSYPFIERNGECKYSKSKIVPGTKPTKIVDVAELDEEALVQAVGTAGPVSVAIYAEDIQLYSSGVFSDNECKEYEVDHGVLAVGYGSQNGVDYWIIKNSWGEIFGEAGYIRMKRGVNICNIALQPSYVLL